VLIGDPRFEISTQKEQDDSHVVDLFAIQVDSTLTRGVLFQDLPGTAQEVNSIGTTLSDAGWSTMMYTGLEATEQLIKGIESPDVLHIATHGFFLEDPEQQRRETIQMFGNDQPKNVEDPMLRSGLLLSGAENTYRGETLAGGENGWLTSSEAASINLRGTQLVVMSACETGQGEATNGRGVFGLPRAIKAAGARTVIMSMWKVPDEQTKDLMTAFYSNWQSGMEKRAAFELAQQQIRATYPHPFYWGAFVMVGE
jgi:CHAT domain-containing protein